MKIFISTYKQDFCWLEYLLKSLEKYAKGFSGITIVCDFDGEHIPAKTLDSVKSIPLDVIYVEPPKTKDFNVGGVKRSGYFWQQWIKLRWFDYCDGDSCMQMDSDCILKQELTPEDLQSKNGAWFWNFRPWSSMNQNNWKPYTEKALGIQNIVNQGMMDRMFVLTKDVTKKLLIHWGKQYGLEEMTWDYIYTNELKFSEYCMYGAFIELIEKPDIHEIRIFQNAEEHKRVVGKFSTKKRSYDGLTEKIIKEYESYLA
jgi:hypothetical protein